MGHQVFSEELVASVVKELQIADLAHATIGEVLLVASRLEQQTGIPFIRMDQGSPGLPANRVGVEAEKAALDRGVGAQYPAADGIPELKREASRFVKAFVDIDISPRACIPTTGSVAASFGAFVITTQCREKTRSCLSIRDFPSRNPSCASSGRSGNSSTSTIIGERR
jgi:hypothetical protein